MQTSTSVNWLAEQGPRVLAECRVVSHSPLSVEWPARTSLHSWQRILLEEQLRLRWRSRERFPDTERWLWTDRSLQQASDWACARFKAALVPNHLALIDACSGAGVDLVASAINHQVLGIDLDPTLVRIARSNLATHDLKGIVCRGDVTKCIGSIDGYALHIDPDRRMNERRTTHGDLFSPPLDEVMRMGSRASTAIIKLAPATELMESDLVSDGWHRVWLGTARECPQQLLVRGMVDEVLTLDPNRVSVALVKELFQFNVNMELPSLTDKVPVFSGQPSERCSFEDEPDEYVYEPHPALYSSGLVPCWANQLKLSALAHPSGYFTGPEVSVGPWSQKFRVVDHLSWDDKKIRKWLRENQVGQLEVKSRLHPIDASLTQKKYSSSAGVAMVCLITKIGRSVRAIMAQRTG